VAAITGIGVATQRPWSCRLSLVVGVTSVIAGFGGQLLLLGASLLAVGMFPATLLDPLNLTIALVMGVTGLTGIGLLRRADLATTTDKGSWLVRSWHPVTAGIAMGIAAAWNWSAFIWPLIPYECCLA
jgi:hypothetical protein